MAKKIPKLPTRPVVKRGVGYAKLVKAISQVNTGMVARAAVAVNQALVLRNWLIGAYIVEFEQNGSDRAKYGARLLPTLAEDLKAQGLKGLGAEMLRSCRSFFLCYPQISQPVVGELALPDMPFPISQPLYGKLEASADIIATRSKGQRTQEALPSPLSPEQLARISWTHFLELIRIEDPWKRAFYENELLQGNWSKRQLQRQIGSLLYERTALSTNKRAVIERARKQDPPESITEMMRDPYILEFTGLSERHEYSEDELEAALLDHLQGFLLELGRGFCFEARQFRMTEGRKHHRVDLVFYHRILRCHVLIDLKIRAFKPADAGQIHPVRYSYADLLFLRLHSSKPERRKPLHRFHERFAPPNRGTSGRSGDIHERSVTSRTRVLRSMPLPSRRHQARKVSEKHLGKALPEGASRGLSHGVNFYVNWFKANMMHKGDNPPVGILLCSDSDGTEVEFATAGMDQKLFVSRYLVALPSVEKLRRFLEADRERIESLMAKPAARKRAPRKPKS